MHGHETLLSVRYQDADPHTMLQALKSLFVILTLAICTFALVKPICLQFMAEDLFRRRTRVWLALTVGSFLAPNLWLFAAVAIPLVYWATRLDPHPSALYAFLLLTVPPVSLPIPMPVINHRKTSRSLLNS